jgi:hypothetical protein
MSILNATSSGLSVNSDNTGVLYLQSSGANTFVINASGAIGVGLTPSYGTSGQSLLSAGSGAPATWGAAGVSTGKAAALAIVL